MSWLDQLIGGYSTIQVGGSALPVRKVFNLVSGASAIDNPSTKVTDITISGGGGTAPGGATTNVQYNKAGAFAGDAAFAFDDTGKVLSVASIQALAGYIASITPAASGDISPDGVIRLGYNSGTDTDPIPVVRIREHSGPSDYDVLAIALAQSAIALGSTAWNLFLYGASFQVQASMPNVYDTSSTITTDLTEVSETLQSNFTDTSGTVANTTLTFPMGASEIWEVECYGNSKAVTSGGVKFRFTVPTNAIYEASVDGVAATLTARNATVLSGTAAAGVTATSGAFTSGNNIPGPVIMRMRIKGDGVNAGNVTLQAAAVTAGQTATVFAGFYMRAHRVTEV